MRQMQSPVLLKQAGNKPGSNLSPFCALAELKGFLQTGEEKAIALFKIQNRAIDYVTVFVREELFRLANVANQTDHVRVDPPSTTF